MIKNELNAIDDKNWSSHCYQRGELLAFISIGGHMSPEQGPSESSLCYYLTVSNADFIEQFQEEFADLSLAINQLNQRYSGWELRMRGQGAGSGCDTCAAH